MRDGKFTPELGRKICEMILHRGLVKDVCKEAGISVRTLNTWRNPEKTGYKEEFSQDYEEAVEGSADLFADAAIEEANNFERDWWDRKRENKDGVIITERLPNGAGPNRSRLIVDTMLRMAGVRSAKYKKSFEGVSGNTVINVVSYADRHKELEKAKTKDITVNNDNQLEVKRRVLG